MEFHRILVPISGTPTDEEAINLACYLARKDKAKIWAVYVIPIDRTLPLDIELDTDVHRAETILDEIEQLAAGKGFVVETDLLQEREIGPTIVDAAVEHEVDLIVMGISYKRLYGQFSMGNVLPHVMKNAPCRVILYHNIHPE